MKPVNNPEKINTSWTNVNVPDNFFKECKVPGVADAVQNQNPTAAPFNTDYDNGDLPVILGTQLRNPYSIANMQQASMRLYGSDEIIYVTHLYVRYKPETIAQLSLLVEDNSLELQDYPMDYEVLQEGQYYQDPTLENEQIGWLYTVVPANYVPVAGIEYEILQELYIPPDDNLLLEGMAESLAGGAAYDDTVIVDYRHITRTDAVAEPLIVPNRFPVPCEVDPCHSGCVTQDECGTFPTGNNPGTPGEYHDPRIPRGIITVQDQRTCSATNPIVNVAVRQARVVCKRWFKIWRGYTNDQGEFISSRKFKHKVKINVKTFNDNAKIAKIRGIRLWQMFFPITKKIGVFDQGDMAYANYTFRKPKPTNSADSELPYWVAATVHNSVIEHREYAEQDGMAAPPLHLHIILSNWNVGDFKSSGTTPLWNKCPVTATELPFIQAFIEYFIAQPSFVAGTMNTLVDILKNQTDMAINYLAPDGEYDCRLTSAAIKATTYHELSHASHYSQAGCNYWYTYRNRLAKEITEKTLNPGGDAIVPYGDGTETDAGVVALGEMWGYYMEHIYADRHYGNGGANGTLNEGGFTADLQYEWPNDPGGLNCHLIALENFNPNLLTDNERWIPKGLPYDLWDGRNDRNFNVINPNDNVVGYTIQQCFNALQSDVRTIPAFRYRLLLQNGNNQNIDVNTLFDDYNY
ncbi:MAG: hypothetical protein ABI402_05025 [Ferruginibacter sp.]